MTISPIMLVLSGTSLMVSTPAASHGGVDVGFAGWHSVSDAVLGESHGLGVGLIATRNMQTVTAQRARDDAEFIGSIAQTQMDVWWQTDGAGLIAASSEANPMLP